MQNSYYSLLDTFPLPSFIIDKECCILRANPIGLKAIQVVSTAIEQQSLADYYPEISQCIALEGENFETFFVDANGNKNDVVLKFVSINEGALFGVVYVIKDYHVMEKRKFNEIILNNIPADIAVFDRKHNYLFVNPNGIRDDATRKWLIGKNDFDYCDYKALDKTLAMERRAFFNQSIQTQKQVEWIDEYHKNGNDSYVMRRFFPVIIDDQFYYMIGYGIDISELKKTQNTIINNENRTKQILTSAHDAIVKFDAEGKITFWNPKAELYFGWKSEEVHGKIVFDLIFPQAISKSYEKHIKNYLDGDERVILDTITESIGRNKNKIKFPIEISILPLKDDYGVITFCTFVRDITLRKEKEAQVELQNKMLQSKNSELEQFTYITSHDLQEPVLSLISFSELLFEEYAERLDDEAKLYIEFINKSAYRMRALIKGLMEYARIGKKEDFTAIDCNAIISDVLSDLSEKISNAKAVIEVQTLPNIKGQSTYIRLLFQNLISNAIKFVNPDVQPIIRISCSETLKEWKFSVEDNGIGIDQKHIDQIFIIFKRLNNDTLYKGYGIGLAHCKKIVDLHHGEIHVNSIVAKGSTFSFTISKNLL
jgi:PAS domain S-box-containing protein